MTITLKPKTIEKLRHLKRETGYPIGYIVEEALENKWQVHKDAAV